MSVVLPKEDSEIKNTSYIQLEVENDGRGELRSERGECHAKGKEAFRAFSIIESYEGVAEVGSYF